MDIREADEVRVYYYRQSNDEEPIVLKVDVLDDREGHISVVWLPGDNAAEPLEQCHGDWAGPIEPPLHRDVCETEEM